MKATIAIAMGLLGVLLSHAVIANGYDYNARKTYRLACASCSQESVGYENNCGECRRCPGYDNVNCNCADPQCYSCNPCLSSQRCCEVFGNIGSADFEPIRPCGNCL